MRDIYHFRSHQLYKQIEDSVSCIVRLLERHEYSIKALYTAQLFILKELVYYDSKIKYSKKKISKLRKTASLKAKESKDELGELKNEIKNEISELYKEASNIEIAKENTSASYYKCSRKELIYYMVKKQPPDSIELSNYKP